MRTELFRASSPLLFKIFFSQINSFIIKSKYLISHPIKVKSMNTKKTRLHCKENKVKLQNSIISLNLKRGGPKEKQRVAIKKTALGHSYTVLEIKSLKSLSTNKFFFFRDQKKLPVCFSLEEENTSSLGAKKSEIQIGHRGPSVWIVYNAKKAKKKFFDALASLPRAVFSCSHPFSLLYPFHPLPLRGAGVLGVAFQAMSFVRGVRLFPFSASLEPPELKTTQMNQKFKSKMYFFGTYKIQKYFSNIEEGLRQGCQWFIIYVMGSFCWLYLVQYSKGINPLNGSKISFLFKEILFENLPLLSEKGLIFEGLMPEFSSTGREKISLKIDDNIQNNSINERFISIELTPVLQEKLQNFIGKKILKSENMLTSTWNRSDTVQNSFNPSKSFSFTFPTQELLFFARKPIFFKGLISVFPTSVRSLASADKFAAQKLDLNQDKGKSILYSSGDNSTISNEQNSIPIFLQNQILPQKKIYNFAGTSLIIDPTMDLLPRKLESCNKQQGLKLKQKGGNNYAGALALGEQADKVLSINLRPQLGLGEKAVWCDILRHTTKETCFEPSESSKQNVLWVGWPFRPSPSWPFGPGGTPSGSGPLGRHPVGVPPGLKGRLGRASLDSARFSKNMTQPLANGLKSRKLSKIWVKVNSFKVLESLQDCLTFAQKKWVNAMFLSNSLESNPKDKARTSQLLAFNRPIASNIANMPLSQKGLVVPNIFLKKKYLKNKSQKVKEFFNQPRLHSNFNFPNMPIFHKNKEKLKEGLGLSLNPQFQLLSIKSNMSSLKLAVNTIGIIQEKSLFDKNPFFDWIYEQNSTSEYLFYSGGNAKSLNLQKNTARFVILDKETDIKITPSCYGKKLVSFSRETAFINKIFSSKRNLWSGLLDAPENFFGTPYLKIGERFTIEKLKGQNQINTLYNIHNGSVFISLKTITSPYASMGTSLNTVFGKKRFTNSQSKKTSKSQNLIPQGRLVTAWSTDSLVSKTIVEDWLNKNLKDNDLSYSHKTKQKQNSWPKDNHIHKILKILSFKRLSGKVNRNITLPFKYYNPGIKRERNIEDTMLVLEGFKKSRLFPTIHNSFRGIATSLPFSFAPANLSTPSQATKGVGLSGHENGEAKASLAPGERGDASSAPRAKRRGAIEIENKVNYAAQDIDLQSILAGMRQRTESQRIATNLSEPSNTYPTKSLKNKNEGKEDRVSSIENNLVLNSGQQHFQKNKKKRRLSNYYPLCTSLTVWPQTSFSQKVLGSTDIVLSNFSGSFNLFTTSLGKTIKGSPQTKGFYFEKLLCSKSIRNFFENGGFAPNLLSKIFFFTGTWYSYKLLATPLSHSTQFLPATFTEALGLQSFQQKYRIIKGNKTRQTFKNLAGAEKTLSELRDLIWTFRLVGTGSPNREQNFFTLFPYIGSRVGQLRKSVFSKSRNRFLLAGPPGTGKTLLVKALAAEANLPVIVQPVSSLQMISGVENPVSALFHVARQIKPCIIFLDELDTLGNDVNVSTNNSTADQKLGIRLARKYTYTLLLELDGLTSSTRDLLIIGATNRLETLNPALTRAGRFETIINFNLPSQDIRTTLFAFYLGGGKQKKELFYRNNSKLIDSIQEKKSYLNSSKNKKIAIVEKTGNKSVLLESYLAQKSSGLSHASIETIINESALESMLHAPQDPLWPGGTPSGWRPSGPPPGLKGRQRPTVPHGLKGHPLGEGFFKPIHTVETLERAIQSVKTLTSRTTLSIFNVKDENFFSKNLNQLILNSLQSQKRKVQKPVISRSLKPFQQEFLVTRVYQIIGPLIISTKLQEINPKRTKKTTRPVSNFLYVQKKPHLTINRKQVPSTRKDLQSCLLHEYSGIASLRLYNVTKPQTFIFLERSGLYQNPSYVAAIILTLKILTSRGSFFTQNSAIGNSLSWGLNYEKKVLPLKRGVTTNNWTQFSGFTSENNLNKYFGSDRANLNTFAINQKYSLFWKNRKIFKKFVLSTVRFTGHNNPISQSLLRDVKYNRLPTSWFRIYLSRPFFRYDSFNYIENKEYYPKNNYILKRNTLFRRNVATLSHTIISRQFSPRGFSTHREIKPLDSVNVKNSELLTFKQFPNKDISKKLEKTGHFLKEKQATFEDLDFSGRTSLEQKFSFGPQSRESLYLAIVASIFNKGLYFFNNNRELTDYCAYIFLRYGKLYEFYLAGILKKF